MELKVSVAMPPLKVLARENPFNGIESEPQHDPGYDVLHLVNPFNGIERFSEATRKILEGYGAESIQWN